MSVCSILAHYERQVLVTLGVTSLTYFIVMDLVLYNTFMRVNLVDEKLEEGEMLTVFHPLSVKLVMNDHVTHYVTTPLSESLCYYTNFGVNFFYITPNVITFTHLGLGFLSAKFVFADTLYRRRIGILIYEIRTFLDAFDGSVYRAHAKDKSYKSDHSNFGYWIDVSSDTLSAFALSFAILFYFWWKCPPRDAYSKLPVFHTNQTSWKANGAHKNGDVSDIQTDRRTDEYSMRFIFWKVFCFGAFWGFTGAMWDQLAIQYQQVFTAKLDGSMSVLQSELQHTSTTWWIMWCWRIMGGQSLLQFVCLAVCLDKSWELFRYTQYSGFVVSAILTVISRIHLSHLRTSLGI